MNNGFNDFSGIEFDGNIKKEYVDEKGLPISDDIRFATVIFIPDIGTNTENPPLRLAMNIIKREAEKVAFKYNQLSNWEYFYGMVIGKKYLVNGSPAVMIRMPYSIRNEEEAKNMLKTYIEEICTLTSIKYTELYYNAATYISFKYPDLNVEQLEVTEHHTPAMINCELNAGLITSARALYLTTLTSNITTNLFVYSKNINCKKCQLSTVFTGDQISRDKLKETVERQLKNSGLTFTSYTIV